MTIATYTDLQTSVANWLHRTDLTALIPDFITLAESNLNGHLDSRSMEVRLTLTCNPGTGLVNRLVALPTDMLEMRRLLVVNDPAIVLEYKTPDQLVEDNMYLTAPGIPTSFAIIAGSIELSPTPDSAYPLELIYQQRLPALSVSNPTNWLITSNPNAYLFGTLLQATPYIQNDARITVWERFYKEAIEATNSIDWYSGSTMRVRSR